MTALMVALGAFVGAPARYLTDRAIHSRHAMIFPLGTLTVNVAASFIFGLVTAAAGELAPNVVTLLGPGFCGGLSTYSTFGYETLRLAEDGARAVAVLNVLANLVVGLAAVALGWALGTALT